MEEKRPCKSPRKRRLIDDVRVQEATAGAYEWVTKHTKSASSRGVRTSRPGDDGSGQGILEGLCRDNRMPIDSTRFVQSFTS